ncbi:hypothetical protein [Bradyrhizobium sp. CCBAU 45384]|uniref:hypothetical protein n=1 Tax=Bradyrhizobium sp. CCBAU 45384 TaxID=858428 RepID=UPI002305BC05|nr:hypothetical protein [Bradyrhizobium sp. CCBAU 45384]
MQADRGLSGWLLLRVSQSEADVPEWTAAAWDTEAVYRRATIAPNTLFSNVLHEGGLPWCLTASLSASNDSMAHRIMTKLSASIPGDIRRRSCSVSISI